MKHIPHLGETAHNNITSNSAPTRQKTISQRHAGEDTSQFQPVGAYPIQIPCTAHPSTLPDSTTLKESYLKASKASQSQSTPHHKPSQPHPSRFLQRNLLYQKHSTLKKMQTRRQHIQKNTVKCTFTPKISPVPAYPPPPFIPTPSPASSTYKQLHQRKNIPVARKQTGKTYNQLIKESVKLSKKYRQQYAQEHSQLRRKNTGQDTELSQLKEIYKDILAWPEDQPGGKGLGRGEDEESKEEEKEEEEDLKEGQTSLKALIKTLNNYERKAYIREEDRPIRQIIEEVIRSSSPSPTAKSPPHRPQMKRQPSWKEREEKGEEAQAVNPKKLIALRRTVSITQQIPDDEMEKSAPVRGGMSFNSNPRVPPIPTPIEESFTKDVPISEQKQISQEQFFDQILEQAGQKHRETVSAASIDQLLEEPPSKQSKQKIAQSELLVSHKDHPIIPISHSVIPSNPSPLQRHSVQVQSVGRISSAGSSRHSIESSGTSRQVRGSNSQSKRWQRWSIVLSERNIPQQQKLTTMNRSSIQTVIPKNGTTAVRGNRTSLPTGTGHSQHQDWLNRLKNAAQQRPTSVAESQKIPKKNATAQQDKGRELQRISIQEDLNQDEKSKEQEKGGELKIQQTHTLQMEVKKEQGKPSSPIHQLFEDPPPIAQLFLEPSAPQHTPQNHQQTALSPSRSTDVLALLHENASSLAPELVGEEEAEQVQVVWVRDSEQEVEGELTEVIERGLDIKISIQAGIGQEYPMRINYNMLGRPWMKEIVELSLSRKGRLFPEVIVEQQEQQSKQSHQSK